MPGKQKERAPMPMSGAGLMRFFEDETHGVKIRPHYVVLASIMLMGTVILAHVLFG
ncbi:MAG: preprotein translocase subunit Sec61beta [Candidatus Methanosuratincola sp.]